MEANRYDALLTYARLLSELQSGESEISWQKATPVSKKDRRYAWTRLAAFIFFALVMIKTELLLWAWRLHGQQGISVLSVILLAAVLAVCCIQMQHAVRILRMPAGSMQPENFTLYFTRTRKGRYSHYPKNTLKARCGKYLPDWDSFTQEDWQTLLPDAPAPEDLQRLICAVQKRLAEPDYLSPGA